MQRPSPNQNHATLILQSALLCFLVFNSCAKSQSLPPAKYDGFVYTNNPNVDSDPIIIEAFFDPVCPDSRDAWPPLKQALQHYSPHVSLVVHLLPLPLVIHSLSSYLAFATHFIFIMGWWFLESNFRTRLKLS